MRTLGCCDSRFDDHNPAKSIKFFQLAMFTVISQFYWSSIDQLRELWELSIKLWLTIPMLSNRKRLSLQLQETRPYVGIFRLSCSDHNTHILCVLCWEQPDGQRRTFSTCDTQSIHKRPSSWTHHVAKSQNHDNIKLIIDDLQRGTAYSVKVLSHKL